MRTYTFTLTLAGVDELTPEIFDALFKAGFNGDDNDLAGSRDGRVFVDCEREADSLGDAVGVAIKQVEKAGFKVARIEVEEPATAA
jgi:hypothetical protein